MRVLFNASPTSWDEWSPALRTACPEMVLTRDAGDPARIDAIIHAPGGPVHDFGPFGNVRLVQSLWAGVERIVTNPTLTQPLARMVDPGLSRGMAEYCTGWTMRAHLEMDRCRQDGIWRNGQIPPLASQRPITILGMGHLGQATARYLRALQFPVTGVSQSGRAIDDVTICRIDDLPRALSTAQIVIALLPDTPATCGILNARTLAMLPEGATIINPGRGTLIDDTALLAAMDAGQVGHAVLDVFHTEPLPADHPYWSHPKVTVTPHIAADTRPQTAVHVVADNLRRAMSNRQIRYLVDRDKGY